MKLDHVGIAVPDLEEALRFWRDRLGAAVTHLEDVRSEGVRVAFLETGADGGNTELLQPIDDDGPVARFLASGRKGVHHLAYRVDDLEDRLRVLREAGSRLIDDRPRAGSRGTRVAFIHPRAAGGPLIELVEYPVDR